MKVHYCIMLKSIRDTLILGGCPISEGPLQSGPLIVAGYIVVIMYRKYFARVGKHEMVETQ